jgi:uncharacterized protein YkwD
MRTLIFVFLMLSLSAVGAAQTVRVQGKEFSYKMVDGKQMVARRDLAQVFPEVEDGEGMLDLEEFVSNPQARVMRRNGLIVSLRFHDPRLAAMYASEPRAKPRPNPGEQQVGVAAKESAEGVESGEVYRAVMDEIVRLSNIERGKYGAPPLSADRNLEMAATGHSEEMARMSYFSHDSPVAGRSSPGDRIALTGILPRRTGENIAKFGSYPIATLAENAVVGWMNSPPHRRNLLDPNFTHIGIGVARNGRTYYLTQNFCTY